jgi:hypothetical protein
VVIFHKQTDKISYYIHINDNKKIAKNPVKNRQYNKKIPNMIIIISSHPFKAKDDG